MSNDAKVLVFLVIGALVVLFLTKTGTIQSLPRLWGGGLSTVGTAPSPGVDASLTEGPEYLLYNTPWPYMPTVGSFLPSMTEGQIGQTNAQPVSEPAINYGGCDHCG